MQDLDLVETSGNLTNLMPGVGVNGNHSDFFFGDGDIDQINFEYDELGGIQNGQVGEDDKWQKLKRFTRFFVLIGYQFCSSLLISAKSLTSQYSCSVLR